MKRRQFLTSTSAALLTAAGVTPRAARRAFAQGQPGARRLSMPPLLDTRATGRLSLATMSGSNAFGGGPAAEVHHALNEPVSAHWHGLLVPGEHDGGPHLPIAPGATWRPAMCIAQDPATVWYHSHIHERPHLHAVFRRPAPGASGGNRWRVPACADRAGYPASRPRREGGNPCRRLGRWRGMSDLLPSVVSSGQRNRRTRIRFIAQRGGHVCSGRSRGSGVPTLCASRRPASCPEGAPFPGTGHEAKWPLPLSAWKPTDCSVGASAILGDLRPGS